MATKPVSSDLAEFLVRLKAMSKRLCSPTIMIMEVSLPAINAQTNSAEHMRFVAMRNMLLTKLISLPNGSKQKLKTLQRDYLRYRVVSRYQQTGLPIDKACVAASEYLVDPYSAAPETLRKGYFQMKSLLSQENLSEFCAGLDYDFVIAIAGDEAPKEGTLLHPDFLLE